jgi:hypothetical protein
MMVADSERRPVTPLRTPANISPDYWLAKRQKVNDTA